nr:MAG: replication initiator protein [Microvirus sp.]
MCLYPQIAQLNQFGTLEFNTEGNLRIPCGKCTECISKRSLEWATRARHEISCHFDNCFLTLTYDNSSLPSILVVKNEFQKFIKRLRKKTKLNIRYMVSHEYGSTTFRPHHHAIIFGYNPPNQILLRKTPKGESIFTSSEIETLWPLGYHSIGTANERTAYYIASYSLKGKKHLLVDPQTGEETFVSDCMDCSKRPAIGYNYFVKNFQQLIDSNTILPRYYFKKLQEINPTLHEHYENERMLKFKNRSSHEVYAKFIIDQQKITESEFRFCNEQTITASTYLEKELLTNRDEYHLLTKGKK